MKASIHRANCWKFNSYEIKHNAVRPGRATELLTYDPWKAFPPGKGRDRRVSTLWGAFLSRVRHIQADCRDRYTPSPKGAQLIVDWSNQWGLLGILPCQAQMFVLPAVYEPARNHFPTIQTEEPCIVQRKYARVAGHWLVQTAPEFRYATPAEDAMAKVGRLVRQEDLPAGMEHAGLVRWEWEQLQWSQHRWDDPTLPQFFVQRPANDQYPLPLTPEFWKNYQEPLGYWMRSATVFAKSVENVSRYADARFSGKECSVPNQDVNLGLWMLNSLAALESPFYEFGACVLGKSRTSGGLLSAMAEMFFLDLMAGRRAVRCGKCEAIFVSKDRHGRYCSVGCRNAAQTGRYRRKVRERRGVVSL